MLRLLKQKHSHEQHTPNGVTIAAIEEGTA
jgi:hypothetical protein